MVNQALIDVVKNQLAGGVGEQDVKEFLRRRGTDEGEIEEIFKVLSPDAPALSEIPVVEVKVDPVAQLPVEPIAPAPATSVAHGVEREVPPLQPSAPFAPISPMQYVPAEQGMSGIMLPPMPNRKRQIAIIGVIIGVAILLIGGGAYAYYAYVASPEKVIDKMIVNIRDIRSVAFSAEVSVTTSATESLLSSTSSAANPFAAMFAPQGPVTFGLKTSGAFDVLDEGNPKLSFIFSATMDKWPLGDFALGAEYRNLGRNNYIKVNDVPDLGFFSMSFLKNKWFVVQDKAAKEQLGAGDASDSVIPTVTQERRDQLAEAWQDHRFLIVSERLSSEDIDGVATHHYKLTFDKEAFKAWAIKTDAIMQNEPTDQNELDKGLDSIIINSMELWVGKRDVLPHKLLVQASLRDDEDPNKTAEVTLMISGNDFNKVMDITVPEGAKPIEEALQGVFGQMLGEGGPTAEAPTTPQARNDQRRKDIAMIADAIRKNMTDNGGAFACVAGPFPQKATFLGAAGFGMSGYPIESCLVPKYLPAMPKDPTKGGLGMSGYSAFYDPKTKKVTVRAPYAELGSKITITK